MIRKAQCYIFWEGNEDHEYDATILLGHDVSYIIGRLYNFMLNIRLLRS